MAQKKVLLIIDNFRIGGAERLALDQLFALSDLSIYTIALYRQEKATRENPNFLDLESKRIFDKKLKILALPPSDLAQLIILIKLIKLNQFTVIINHSVGASIILRLAKTFSRRNFSIKTFIHQLPTLSAPAQRFKRFLYVLASDEIYAYSNAVAKDWNNRIDRNLLSRFFLGWKRPKVLRNGIYLQRLPLLPRSNEDQPAKTRMVFIGRGVAWKNMDFILSFLRSATDKTISSLMILPKIDPEVREALNMEFGERIEFEIGRRVEDIVFTQQDVHIYPVNYGPDAKFIESISLNCLEMACIGIPSLVSKDGCETWPELTESGIVQEVDWKQEEKFEQTLARISELEFNGLQINEFRSFISIENNLKHILDT